MSEGIAVFMVCILGVALVCAWIALYFRGEQVRILRSDRNRVQDDLFLLRSRYRSVREKLRYVRKISEEYDEEDGDAEEAD